MVIRLIIFVVLLSSSNAAKLPANVVPTKYLITLQTDFDKEILSYSGKVKIDVNVLIPTRDVLLNMHSSITVRDVDVYNPTTRFLDSNFSPTPPVNDIFTIRLDAVLAVGAYTIEMLFSGNLRNDGLGFFVMSFQNDSGGKDFVAATNFHTNYAHFTFPCFDEPQFLAKFNLEIKHNKSYIAISNKEIKQRIENVNNYATSIFEETESIPTYAFGFVVLNFRQVGPNAGRIEHRVYAQKKTIFGEFSKALSQGDMVIEMFHDLFGMPALNKLNQIILPGYADTPNGFHPCGIMLANETHLDNGDGSFSMLALIKSIARKYSVNYDYL